VDAKLCCETSANNTLAKGMSTDKVALTVPLSTDDPWKAPALIHSAFWIDEEQVEHRLAWHDDG